MSAVAFCAGRGSDKRQYSTVILAGCPGQMELSCLASHLRGEACRDKVGAKTGGDQVRNRCTWDVDRLKFLSSSLV
jgi:hypothetical protein